ncbi:MAG: spore cortex-lytic enzyme, partial [Oscillospiraceae bacterium]
MNNKRKLTAALAVIFTINILIILFAQSELSPQAEAVAYKRGSSGSVVTQIQKKLSQWGYYSGSVDGIYGSRTEKAVIWFQKKNGLTADGVAGTATLRAIGISDSSGTGTQDNNVALLARLISAESRGEPYSGQVAVGAVVLNRVEHPSFPNSLSGVIYQSGAFTCMTDGQFSAEVTDSAYKAARDAINGVDPSGGAIYYFNPAKATSKWIWS